MRFTVSPSFQVKSRTLARMLSKTRVRTQSSRGPMLSMATVIPESDVFVLYLNCATFVGVAGASLAEEVRAARASKLQLLLVHELDAVREAAAFQLFLRRRCAA